MLGCWVQYLVGTFGKCPVGTSDLVLYSGLWLLKEKLSTYPNIIFIDTISPRTIDKSIVTEYPLINQGLPITKDSVPFQTKSYPEGMWSLLGRLPKQRIHTKNLLLLEQRIFLCHFSNQSHFMVIYTHDYRKNRLPKLFLWSNVPDSYSWPRQWFVTMLTWLHYER